MCSAKVVIYTTWVHWLFASTLPACRRDAQVLAQLMAAIATIVGAVFATSLLVRYRRGGRTQPAQLVWGVALIMFSIASLALFTGVVGGWTPTEFRVFYLFGGVLNVPWLALGSLIVNVRSLTVTRLTGAVLAVVAVFVVLSTLRAEETELWLPSAVLSVVWALILIVGHRQFVLPAATAVLITYSVIATVVVARATFVLPLPVTGLPEGAELFFPVVRGYAVGGNSVGAVVVIISALIASAAMVWRRPDREADRLIFADARQAGFADAIARWVFRGRTGQGSARAHLVRGNLMIAGGVGLAAAGGVLSFLGDTVGHAVAFTVGVIVMYGGFIRTTRPLATT